MDDRQDSMGSAVSTLMKPTPDAIVHALAEHARPIIREDYRVDSCIVSTLVGIEALRYFGYPRCAAVGEGARVQPGDGRSHYQR